MQLQAVCDFVQTVVAANHTFCFHLDDSFLLRDFAILYWYSCSASVYYFERSKHGDGSSYAPHRRFPMHSQRFVPLASSDRVSCWGRSRQDSSHIQSLLVLQTSH
jgi:hypothetical protein